MSDVALKARFDQLTTDLIDSADAIPITAVRERAELRDELVRRFNERRDCGDEPSA
jgi:hypothetical protein